MEQCSICLDSLDSALPKKPRFVSRQVEGARSKANGKWSNPEMFPGREFDDLDAYRAAKKQRVAKIYR